jgi:hypothetical protein
MFDFESEHPVYLPTLLTNNTENEKLFQNE